MLDGFDQEITKYRIESKPLSSTDLRNRRA